MNNNNLTSEIINMKKEEMKDLPYKIGDRVILLGKEGLITEVNYKEPIAKILRDDGVTQLVSPFVSESILKKIEVIPQSPKNEALQSLMETSYLKESLSPNNSISSDTKPIETIRSEKPVEEPMGSIKQDEKERHIPYSLEFSLDLSRKVLCYSEYCCKDQLTLTVFLDNKSDAPFGKFSIQLSTSANILINLDKWTVNGFIGEIESNKSSFTESQSFTLNPQLFLNLTEKSTETITASLVDSQNNIVKTIMETIEIEPMDYWNGSIQTIPFFIERNHPDVIALQKQVSQAMLAISGTNALNAYQSEDIKRVLNQCAAIYSTIQSQKLVYTEPKQSDDFYGQRIRPVSDILRDKAVTCLDSTILFCALAESIGLHTIICVTEDHAFPGVWLEKNRLFNCLIHDDPSDIVSLSEPINQKICVIESTAVTSIPLVSFKDACRIAREKALSCESIRILDVHFARSIGISPMPRRIVLPTGDVLFENDPHFKHENNTPDEIIEYDPGELTVVDNTPKTRIDTWERKLITLSSRSPLLNENIRGSSLQILHPQIDQLENELENGVSFSLVPNPMPNIEFELQNDIQIQNCSNIFQEMAYDKKLCTGENEKNLEKKLKLINRKAQNELSETGVNPLFLALGHIEWADKSSIHYYAPIVLYPVSLTKKTRREFMLSLRDGEEPQLNYSIFEKMAKEFGIKSSLDYDNLPKDERGFDIRRILQIVKHDIEKEPNWRVGESCLLGLFSFDQYILWNDIHKHSDLLLKNKIVYSLENGYIPDSIDTLPDVDDSDNLEETVPVSCDESQMRAVKAAGNGCSFILQGPPGTGKSQTITAMIVNALLKGKKVLFVAEKMAALQVVYRNLCQVKCNDYLLEMHSTKLSKSHLIEQIERALDRNYSNEPKVFQEKKSISELDATLKEYIDILHKKNRCGLSLYELINKYEKYRGMEDYQMRFSDIAEVSPEELDATYSELRELSRSLSKFMPITNNNFRFFHFTNLNDEEYSVINSELLYLASKRALFEKQITDVVGILGIDDRKTFDFSFVKGLNTVISLVEKIHDTGIPTIYLESTIKEIDDSINSIQKYQTANTRYLRKIDTTMNPAILKKDIPSLLREWDSIKTGIFKAKKRKEFISFISSYSSIPIQEKEIESCLRKLNEIGFESENVSSCLNTIPALFREEAKDNCSDLIKKLSALKSILNQASQALYDIRKHSSSEKDVSVFLIKCVSNQNELKEYSKSINEVNESWFKLMDILKPDDEIQSYSIEGVYSLIDFWKDNINSFVHWGRCNSLKNKIAEKPYAHHYINKIIDGENPESIYKQMVASFTRTQIESIVLDNPIMERYDAKGFQSLIDQLEDLERKYRDSEIQNVHAKLNKMIEEHVNDQKQMATLKFFIATKGKKRSIRSLFSECNEVITNLFPCLLMSPMSVSQFFEAGNQVFDLVIMDEASQIQTCKAIGAIARGKELIVVGDSKQMPPTNFFNKTSEDEDYLGLIDESKTDLESILEDCSRIDMPQLQLNWHYRSKNESLIHFSNTHYYRHKLKTYPSVDSMISRVKLKKVVGYYQSDSKEPNPAEAEAIILEIVRRLKDPVLCNDSIGVITFNEKQQNHIIRELDKRFEREPELAKIAHWDENEIDCPSKLIVKNLENIQGDERDVIMLSVTFGKTKSGRFIKNFGPIGKVGGEKRLNVAFSRAKKEMLVFTIIDVSEFANQELNSRGANDLKEFLKYASNQTITTPQFSSAEAAFDEICSLLSKKGYLPVSNVGLSDFKIDIALKNPEKEDDFFCAILFDGHNMQSAALTNDRFILRKEMLIARGWKVIQARIMDWYNNPNWFMDYLIEDIEKSFASYKEELLNASVVAPSTSMNENEVLETSYAGEYVECKLPYDELPPSKFLNFDENLIANKMKKVIDVEGPIIDDLLEMRVANAYGIKKRGKNIREFLDSILEKLNAVHTTQIDTEEEVHNIYWPESYRDSLDTIDKKYISFRTPSETNDSKKRQIKEYPQIEIRNAMASHIKISGPMVKETLIIETCNKLGFKRIGREISDTLELVLNNTLNSGYFKRDEENGRIYVSE